MNARRPRILFLNRSYYPCGEATGQLLTQLCEDLASSFVPCVVAGRPDRHRADQSGAISVPRREVRRGVEIRRARHTSFSKRRLWGRLMNLATFTASTIAETRGLERPDVVIAETDPPFLCLVARRLADRFRCPYIAYLQDLHPDLGIALGRLRKRPHVRWLHNRFLAAYKSADRVVVPGSDMRDTLVRSGVDAARIEIMPNWADTRAIVPRNDREGNPFRRQHRLVDRFVVMYSGNVGLCQDLESVLDAAEQLLPDRQIVFAIVGAGAARDRLHTAARRRRLDNVRFFPPQPISALADSLGAADLHLVPVDPRAYRYLMPSKLYGCLAAGRPVLAVAPAESELARLVTDEEIGCHVPPQDPATLAATVRALADDHDRLRNMGERARKLAMARFDRKQAVGTFSRILHEVLARTASCGFDERAEVERQTAPSPEYAPRA